MSWWLGSARRRRRLGSLARPDQAGTEPLPGRSRCRDGAAAGPAPPARPPPAADPLRRARLAGVDGRGAGAEDAAAAVFQLAHGPVLKRGFLGGFSGSAGGLTGLFPKSPD